MFCRLNDIATGTTVSSNKSIYSLVILVAPMGCRVLSLLEHELHPREPIHLVLTRVQLHYQVQHCLLNFDLPVSHKFASFIFILEPKKNTEIFGMNETGVKYFRLKLC